LSAAGVRPRDLALLAAATVASYIVGLLVGGRWLLPVLNAAPAYALMARDLHAGARRAALQTMLVWALLLAVCGTLFFALWPHDPGSAIVHGPEYREEMFRWIRTGEGTEGTPRLFLPQHLLHLAAFVVLSLLTASAVSIFMGAVLMNYMAYYVASLARAGVPARTVLLFGWQPWAIVRIAAFCIFGVLLAEPLLSRAWPYRYEGLGAVRRTVFIASALILADWALKALLAPTWGLVLRPRLVG
jgi:hypothetical protein